MRGRLEPERQREVAQLQRLRRFVLPVLKRNGPTWIRVIDTGSMYPLLVGDVDVLTDWSTSPEPRVGELAVLSSPVTGHLYVHRAIALDREARTPRVLQGADAIHWTGFVEATWVDRTYLFGVARALRRRDEATLVYLQSSLARTLGRTQALWLRTLLRLQNAEGSNPLRRVLTSACRLLVRVAYAGFSRLAAGLLWRSSLFTKDPLMPAVRPD